MLTDLLPASGTALPLAHLLVWAWLFGMTVWFSFFSGIVLFKRLPKHQFGQAQGALFPVYFRLVSALLAVLAVIQHLRAAAEPLKAKQIHLAVSWVSVALTLVQVVKLEPMLTGWMNEMHRLEKDIPNEAERNAKYLPLKKKFGMWHGISMLLNTLVIVGLLLHGFYIANTYLR